eukprot:2020032-Pleurochrysis_carterae.AAC.1
MLLDDAHGANGRKFCQAPSYENPFANPVPTDWGSGIEKLPACPDATVQPAIDAALAAQPITGQ